MIAEYQLKNGAGISFRKLFEDCRAELIVHSELQLRKHLGEFKDHKMISSKSNKDGTEMVSIKLATSLIQQLLDALISGFVMDPDDHLEADQKER